MAGGNEVQEVDDHGFQELLAGTDRLVVVEFYMSLPDLPVPFRSATLQ